MVKRLRVIAEEIIGTWLVKHIIVVSTGIAR